MAAIRIGNRLLHHNGSLCYLRIGQFIIEPGRSAFPQPAVPAVSPRRINRYVKSDRLGIVRFPLSMEAQRKRSVVLSLPKNICSHSGYRLPCKSRIRPVHHILPGTLDIFPEREPLRQGDRYRLIRSRPEARCHMERHLILIAKIRELRRSIFEIIFDPIVLDVHLVQLRRRRRHTSCHDHGTERRQRKGQGISLPCDRNLLHLRLPIFHSGKDLCRFRLRGRPALIIHQVLLHMVQMERLLCLFRKRCGTDGDFRILPCRQLHLLAILHHLHIIGGKGGERFRPVMKRKQFSCQTRLHFTCQKGCPFRKSPLFGFQRNLILTRQGFQIDLPAFGFLHRDLYLRSIQSLLQLVISLYRSFVKIGTGHFRPVGQGTFRRRPGDLHLFRHRRLFVFAPIL